MTRLLSVYRGQSFRLTRIALKPWANTGTCSLASAQTNVGSHGAGEIKQRVIRPQTQAQLVAKCSRSPNEDKSTIFVLDTSRGIKRLGLTAYLPLE